MITKDILHTLISTTYSPHILWGGGGQPPGVLFLWTFERRCLRVRGFLQYAYMIRKNIFQTLTPTTDSPHLLGGFPAPLLSTFERRCLWLRGFLQYASMITKDIFHTLIPTMDSPHFLGGYPAPLSSTLEWRHVQIRGFLYYFCMITKGHFPHTSTYHKQSPLPGGTPQPHFYQLLNGGTYEYGVFGNVTLPLHTFHRYSPRGPTSWVDTPATLLSTY